MRKEINRLSYGNISFDKRPFFMCCKGISLYFCECEGHKSLYFCGEITLIQEKQVERDLLAPMRGRFIVCGESQDMTLVI